MVALRGDSTLWEAGLGRRKLGHWACKAIGTTLLSLLTSCHHMSICYYLVLSQSTAPSQAQNSKPTKHTWNLPNHKPKQLLMFLSWFVSSFCYSDAEMTNPPGCTATAPCYPSCHTSLCRILQVSGGGDVLLDKSPLLLCFSPICPLVLSHLLISFPNLILLTFSSSLLL